MYTTAVIVREESPFKDDTNIDDDYVERAIEQSDSFIDGRIASVYSLPLSETPAIIQELSTKITIFNLLTDQNLNIEIASGVNLDGMNEQINAIFDAILSRKVKLIDSDGVELDLVDAVLPQGFPNTAETDAGTAPRFFSMSQDF